MVPAQNTETKTPITTKPKTKIPKGKKPKSIIRKTESQNTADIFANSKASNHAGW